VFPCFAAGPQALPIPQCAIGDGTPPARKAQGAGLPARSPGLSAAASGRRGCLARCGSVSPPWPAVGLAGTLRALS
jgi:hypothetical protein